MGVVVAGGFLFWTVAAFLGSRAGFVYERGPLFALLRRPRERAPLALAAAGLVLLAAGGWFCRQELLAIQGEAGIIGPAFFLSVMLGMAGAVLLSALAFIRGV